MNALTLPRGVFDFGNVHFRNDFPAARLSDIKKLNDSTFILTIEPENTPINKSAWYAFKMWSDKKTSVTVSLTYTFGEHRYDPKISGDGRHWKRIAVDGNKTNSAATGTYQLTLTPDTIWFAAQEVITSADVWDWADSLVISHQGVEKELIGKSLEGRPIIALRIGAAAPKPVLVVLGRQHPPEVTGQLAMKSFIEEICGDSQTSKEFLMDYSVVLIPLMNPDGVEHGHWRHNIAGADLNRDWSTFQQPETRSVKEYLERLDALGDSIVFSIDFHSTKTDVFYVVTDDDASLTSQWITSLHTALPDATINKSFHGIESATSKNWFYKRFGAEAVTYEVGDATDRVFLKHLGQIAAMCIQRELLQRLAAAVDK